MNAILDRDSELRALWSTCAGGQATEADWTALYKLVRDVLSHCNAPELARRQEGRATLIDEYFNQKVFLPMRPDLRGPDHCGALVVFFRRYLRDGSGLPLPPPPPPGPGGPDEPDLGGFTDLDQMLREECGTTAADVSKSAQAFLTSLRTEQQWAWLLLRHGFCPDTDERTPLVQLARAHQIPAYHHRAGKLGINHQWDAGLDSFKGTMLGQWLEQALGASVSRENYACVGAALEILCFQALTEGEEPQ